MFARRTRHEMSPSHEPGKHGKGSWVQTTRPNRSSSVSRGPIARWANDFRLGVRLAAAGTRSRRTNLLRLAFVTLGIGLCTTVLLLAATAPTIVGAQQATSAERAPVRAAAPAQASLWMLRQRTEFRGQRIPGRYLEVTGSQPPVPPGLTELPAPGEVVVSPALRELLRSEQGALLRPRLDGRTIVGTIDERGLTSPTELRFYAATTGLIRHHRSDPVAAFGRQAEQPQLGGPTLLIVVLGTVVLLVPMLIFIATSGRIGAAERDRSLANLRLGGADSNQVRRIAAADSLLSGVAGCVLAVPLFLTARAVSANTDLGTLSVYPADMHPPWPVLVGLFVLVPVLTVATTLFGLRNTIIAPLGVVRGSRPVRRRGWWRLALLAVGFGTLAAIPPASYGAGPVLTAATATALLLIGLPTALPWLVERLVGMLRGGKPATQLAVRRLQLDSGGAARVIGGIVVVLAGFVALQTVLSSAADGLENDTQRHHGGTPDITATAVSRSAGDEATRLLRDTPGVTDVQAGQRVRLRGEDGATYTAHIASCAELSVIYDLADGDCASGDVFLSDRRSPGASVVTSGSELRVPPYLSTPGTARDTQRWTVPPITGTAEPRLPGRLGFADILVTPRGVDQVDLTDYPVRVAASVDTPLDTAGTDADERLRNALAPLAWRVRVHIDSGTNAADPSLFHAARVVLYTAAGLVLLLATASLLALAVEQVIRRRRALAALSASGIPYGVLARSMLWQNAIPVGIGVAAALATGLGVAALMMRIAGDVLVIDWPSIAALCGATIVVAAVATGCSLPAVRSATRLEELRTE